MAEARATMVERHGCTSLIGKAKRLTELWEPAMLRDPLHFGTLGVNGTDVFLGTSELPHALEDLMHKSWAAFIATGNPTTQRLPEWPTTHRTQEL
ncbi:MAG: hypothetical protein Ct9H90mP5_03920 [Acidimicrobiaceae bacterium]|nr:MAG: hypothetical protein Ct9H90mP5_03920 [Acidimicrobiaceae bacterium]